MADHKIYGNDGAGNAGIDGLRLVKFENGQFDFRGGPVQYIAEYFAQMMDAGEGKYFNNMEIAFSHQDAGEMVLSVQRKSGKTPIQQRKEAEDERDAANARADRARDAALEDVAVMAHAFAAENQWHPSSVTKLVTRILALRDKPAPAVTVQEAARVLLDQPYDVMSVAFDAIEKLHGEGADRIMAAALRALSETP